MKHIGLDQSRQVCGEVLLFLLSIVQLRKPAWNQLYLLVFVVLSDLNNSAERWDHVDVDSV